MKTNIEDITKPKVTVTRAEDIFFVGEFVDINCDEGSDLMIYQGAIYDVVHEWDVYLFSTPTENDFNVKLDLDNSIIPVLNPSAHSVEKHYWYACNKDTPVTFNGHSLAVIKALKIKHLGTLLQELKNDFNPYLR